MHLKRLNSTTNGTFIQRIMPATLRESLVKHIRKPLYKNAYYLMLSTILSSGFAFIFWMVTARLYEAVALGLASAIISAIELIGLFSNLGLGIGLIRFLPDAGENTNKMINTCFSITGLISILIALIFLAGLNFWSPSLIIVRQQITFLSAFILFAMVSGVIPIINCVFIAKRSTQFILITGIIHRFLSILFAVFFAAIIKNFFGIFVSTALAMSVSLLVAILVVMPRLQPGYRPLPILSKEVLSEIAHYSSGNYISRLFLQIPPLILPLMVLNVLGSEMNAYFYVSWSVVKILQFVPVSISNSLFAEGANQMKEFEENVTKSLKLMLLILVPATLVFLLMADKVLLFFGKSYHRNGALMLRIISISIIPWGINYLYITIGRVRKDLVSVIKVSLSMAFLSIGLSYFLMLNSRLMGVGLGWTLGQSLVALPICLHLLRRFFLAKTWSVRPNQDKHS